MWPIIDFIVILMEGDCVIFVRCWSEVFMKNEGKTWSLGPTLFRPQIKQIKWLMLLISKPIPHLHL